MSSKYVEAFVTLLRSLGLVEGSYKPFPSNSLTSSRATNSTVGFPDLYDTITLGSPVNSAFNSSGAHSSYVTNASIFLPSVGGNITEAKCPAAAYDPPPLTDQTFWQYDSAAAAVYRYRKQQSVNLGSWFVQENWMVPSLFVCASEPKIAEIDIASGWGSVDNARAVLERHWDVFINQTDFDYLASIGINTVRIPIGYWILGPTFLTGTPFEPYASVYRNAWPRLVRAINMAAASNIGVLVDLHGAPGSQNGQPHSGISDGQTRLFSDRTNMDKSLQVLRFLVEQFRNVTNVVGIEILNEPNNVSELPDFYTNAITVMRQESPFEMPDLPLYIHDGFDLAQYSAFISERTDFIVEDHHSYFVFSPEDESESASQHTSDIKGSISSELDAADTQDRSNLVIDEWSCALTAESLSTQADPDEARREFCTAQMDVYANKSAGWSFWSYTKEDCDTDPGWCFKAAVGKCLPGTFYSYGRPPPTDPARLQRAYAAVANMTIPNHSDILGKLKSAVTGSSGSGAPSNTMTAQQQSSIEGYSDGYQTAKIFTQHGWSRLGFTEQYIQDSMGAIGGSLPKGTEEYYRSGFKAGLADGEAVVLAVLSD